MWGEGLRSDHIVETMMTYSFDLASPMGSATLEGIHAVLHGRVAVDKSVRRALRSCRHAAFTNPHRAAISSAVYGTVVRSSRLAYLLARSGVPAAERGATVAEKRSLAPAALLALFLLHEQPQRLPSREALLDTLPPTCLGLPLAWLESLSALVRFVGAGAGGQIQIATVDKFEAALFGPFTAVLTRDVVEFKPYVFQIFAQLLEMRKGHGVSPAYWNLFTPCLSATLWTRGNTPALARLLTAYLFVDAPGVARTNQLQPVLGCWLKATSMVSTQTAAFQLITAFVASLPLQAFQQFVPNIVQTLVTKMQKNMNLRFVSGFLGNFWGIFVGKHGVQVLEQSLEAMQVRCSSSVCVVVIVWCCL